MEFQRELVPYVEDAKVVHLTRPNGEFVLTLNSGEHVRAKRVVVAVGLGYFVRIPEVLANLPEDRLDHTWGRKEFDRYSNQDVVVVGGGSSALETATLLHEHGARVRVLARGQVHWGGRGLREWERSLLDRIRMPISSIGHGRENWVLQHIPWLMHFLPARKRIPFTRAHLGPAPAWWLRDRVVGKFPVQHYTSVLDASVRADRVVLRVREANVGEYEIEADQVVAGTGYEVDVDRIAFLDTRLAAQIRRYDRAPRLSRHFESSVPGLFFIGPVAAASFGPLVRFVAGSEFTVRVVTNRLCAQQEPFTRPWRPQNFDTTRAGTPATTVLGGTSCVTTLPAETTESWPIRTPL
jgi:hypothetical protein